jgi:hypothetical protein
MGISNIRVLLNNHNKQIIGRRIPLDSEIIKMNRRTMWVKIPIDRDKDGKVVYKIIKRKIKRDIL